VKISILTLFPEMFDGFLNQSIISISLSKKINEIEIINFRDYSKNKHKRVDDYQYGGGSGMVIGLQAIVDCLNDIRTPDSHVVLLTPQGKTYDQAKAKKLSKLKHIILVCGHYEGFDERIINFVDETISVGGYILTGGEIPAMLIADSCLRLVDLTINKDSLECESFENNLLDYPVYTKPKDFEGYKVPEVLLSGNHQEINKWRKKQQILKTKKYRTDLYKKYLKTKND